MREFVESAVSTSWALSLLAVNEVANLFVPQATSQAQSTFEPITQAIVSQLGSSLQGTFRTGDNLQRGFINAMFRFATSGIGGRISEADLLGASRQAVQSVTTGISQQQRR